MNEKFEKLSDKEFISELQMHFAKEISEFREILKDDFLEGDIRDLFITRQQSRIRANSRLELIKEKLK